MRWPPGRWVESVAALLRQVVTTVAAVLVPGAPAAASPAVPDTVHRVARRDGGRWAPTGRRVVVEDVGPSVDGGRFPVKREVGDEVVVEADVFADGHDVVAARVRVTTPGGASFDVPLDLIENDRWRGRFTVSSVGEWRFSVVGWVAHGSTWLAGTRARAAAGVDVAVELEIGARMLEHAAPDAGASGGRLRELAASLRHAAAGPAPVALLEGAELEALLGTHGPRSAPTASPEHRVTVDRPLARFGAWYECFPRSASPDPSRPGTLADVEALLPDLAETGFDVVYLPPIHPIGRTGRKGANNSLVARHDDPGSPWAIGSPAGGHDAVAPELGGEPALASLVARANELGLDIALDIAFQCSPDHPWVVAHPEWFRQRPDGTVQHAENPPKRYEDIYPFDFDTVDRAGLWSALRDVVEHWIALGIRVFRVDNPHTKPFAFWEWLIADVKERHPEVLFLSEAFTRPKVMRRLAKLGFSQSYTYFAWRNTASELREYLTELTTGPSAEYLRPSLWPNTPDILTEYLQEGGPPAFGARFVLAATLGATYGIYGPPFEMAVGEPREPGSEEYLHSEKYEVRHWPGRFEAPLLPLIHRVNAARRAHPALQRDRGLRFHDTDNEQILCYSKSAPGERDAVVCVVNLDPRNVQSGWVHVDPADIGLPAGHGEDLVVLRDVLDDSRYTWRGTTNYVHLDPARAPAHVFAVEWTA